MTKYFVLFHEETGFLMPSRLQDGLRFLTNWEGEEVTRYGPKLFLNEKAAQIAKTFWAKGRSSRTSGNKIPLYVPGTERSKTLLTILPCFLTLGDPSP